MEYDKETLRDMVLELQEENQELKKQLEESDFKIANLTMDKIELKKQLEDLQETHYLIQGGRSNGKTYLMKLFKEIITLSKIHMYPFYLESTKLFQCMVIKFVF